MDTAILRDIHFYWFGRLNTRAELPEDRMKLWFRQSDATDAFIRATFGQHITEAAETEWDLEALTREEQVGLVVLLDQFPRNIYRTSSAAFAYDTRARAIARDLIGLGRDRFFLIEQVFVFLPFEHSELVADQDTSVMFFAELAVTCPESFRDYARNSLDFATKHRDLIRRFGRFPHRNVLLDRPSTDEEKAFIAEHGRGY